MLLIMVPNMEGTKTSEVDWQNGMRHLEHQFSMFVYVTKVQYCKFFGKEKRY